jgi:hypothetical protein
MATKRKQEYEKDFYAWTIHNAQLLREGKLSEVDVENIALEIESMGKSEKRGLIHRVAVLLAHLLKWQLQSMRQSRSWQLTIKEQRFQLIELFKDSPSLKNESELKLKEAYAQALIIAERETGFEEKVFPKKCPFSLEQILNKDFFPK